VNPFSGFSTVWKTGFHGVENPRKKFPWRGKIRPFFPPCGKKFSMAWKSGGKIFHGVEKAGGQPCAG
jgi:hypothetical protein